MPGCGSKNPMSWRTLKDEPATNLPLVVAGLFAGIGGIELGLGRVGHRFGPPA